MKKPKVVLLGIAVVLVFASIATANLTDGLIAYYPFNGNAKDETGNGHDGTVYGATLTIDRFGNANSAYYFDGDDYIELANPADFGFNNESFSVSVWVQVFDTGGWYNNFVCWNDADGFPTFTIAKASPTFQNRLYTEIWDSPAQSIAFSVTTGDQLPNNEWLHLVGVIDHPAGELRLYLNDSLQDTDSLINFDFSSASSLRACIGLGAYRGGPHYGLIDDVRIYNRALSASEVTELYTMSEQPPVIEATIDLDPDTLNLKSKGKWITCYIELPEGYDVGDIDIGSILLLLDAEVIEVQHSNVEDGVLMVKFDRQDVIEYVEMLGIEFPADVTLTVTGELIDGTLFEGSDTIRVINPGK